MDPTITVAVVALCGTIITVGGGIIVALITSSKEAKGSAEKGIEKVLKARIELKDEELIVAIRKIQDIQSEKNELIAACDNKDDVIRQLTAELADKDRKLQQMERRRSHGRD